MPPVAAVPKQVSKHQDQVIVFAGKRCILPAGAQIALNVVGTHRNPKYSPTEPSKVTNDATNLNDFRPERWLVKTASVGTQHIDSATESVEDEDFGGFTGHDTSAQPEDHICRFLTAQDRV